MNGHMLESKPLYVALAQRKDVRRAQLEAQHAQRAKLGVGQGQMYPQGAPLYYSGVPMQNTFYPPQIIRRGPYQQQQMFHNVRYPMQMNGNQQQQRPQNIPGQGRGRGRGRGGKTNGQVPAHLGNQVAMGAQAGGVATGTYKYTANARNQSLASQVPVQPASSQAQAQQTADNSQPDDAGQDTSGQLTVKALASAPEEQRKQMIGERLFPKIFRRNQMLAGKITGMLLEMDNGELINLLESENALNDKIDEALAVLHQSQEGDVVEHPEQPEEDKAPS